MLFPNTIAPESDRVFAIFGTLDTDQRNGRTPKMFRKSRKVSVPEVLTELRGELGNGQGVAILHRTHRRPAAIG